jgi:RHS repeat-associated protein
MCNVVRGQNFKPMERDFGIRSTPFVYTDSINVDDFIVSESRGNFVYHFSIESPISLRISTYAIDIYDGDYYTAWDYCYIHIYRDTFIEGRDDNVINAYDNGNMETTLIPGSYTMYLLTWVTSTILHFTIEGTPAEVEVEEEADTEETPPIAEIPPIEQTPPMPSWYNPPLPCQDRNYVLQTISLTSLTDTNSASAPWRKHTVQYFDGLGRKVETIHVNANPNGADLVSYQEYDNLGRESKKWLPAVAMNNRGMFVPLADFIQKATNTYSDDSAPYSQPIYETSPLNRIVEQYAPGASWHDNHRSMKSGFLTNILGNDTLNCVLYKISSAQPPLAGDTILALVKTRKYLTHGILYVTRTEDEDGNASFEFKDWQGQVILRRSILQTAIGKETYDTYSIYDDLGNLVAVLPPEASAKLKNDGGDSWNSATEPALSQYAYLYKYDARRRLIAKKLPGCAWTFYVYDKGDRLIFSQDGNQRQRGEWTFTIPDMLGRECFSGTCQNSLDPFAAPLDNQVVSAFWYSGFSTPAGEGNYKGYYLSGITLTSPTLLSVNYYDDYSFLGKDGLPSPTEASVSYDASAETEGYGKRYETSAQGWLTGTLTAQLDDSSNALAYLYSVMYYDTKGRVVQTKSSNQLAGGTTKEYLAYNFVGQPTKRKVVHSATSKATQTELYIYTYDHAGRPLTTKHQLNGGAEVLLVDNEYDELGRLKTNKRNGNANLRTDYTYNIRSWTKSITSPLFNETLYYNESRDSDSNKSCFNGNISAMDWTVTSSNENKQRGYDFSYDNLSRLTSANYLEGDVASDKFSTAYSYDKHGNITHLARHGNKGTSLYGKVDDVTFTYRGNQLLKAADVGETATLSMARDFKDGADEAVEYAYDANGNMVKDANKQINSIEYNLLNLPKKITFAENANVMNKYIYSATRQKLTAFHQNAASTHRTDYVGNLIYEDGDLSMIQVDGGYIKNGQYYFYLQDHLGSSRVVADANGNVVQANHYYPYGTPFAESYNQDIQKYKYTGKEYDTENGLNLYDFEARQLDTNVGFMSIDPLCEKYYSWSPYVYCKGNPVKLVDADGRKVKLADNYEGAMTNIAQIAATSLGNKVLDHLIDAQDTYTLNSTFWSLNSSYDPSNRNVNYVANPWDKKIEGGTLNSMTAMGHELFHAFDHSNNMFNTENAGYSKDIMEPRAVSFANYLRQVYSMSPLRERYSGIEGGNFNQFVGGDKISNFNSLGHNANGTSFGFSYVKATTTIIGTYVNSYGLTVPKTKTEEGTYYMVVSMDKNNNIRIRTYDNEDAYRKGTANW